MRDSLGRGHVHPEYAGMTVNERLASAGLLDSWDAAAKRRDRDEMIRVLESVELEPTEAARTVDLVLANPRKYGF